MDEKKIVPTVGRVVLYTPRTTDPDHNNAEVLPAVVVRVWSDDMINLKVLNDGSEDFWATSVARNELAEQGTWDWMPFQKDQQARLAKEEDKTA